MKRALPIAVLFLLVFCAVAQAVKECDYKISYRIADWLDQNPPANEQEAMNEYVVCLAESVDRSLQILFNAMEKFELVHPRADIMGTYYLLAGEHESFKSEIESRCLSEGPAGSMENGYCLIDGYIIIKSLYRKVKLLVEKIQ